MLLTASCERQRRPRRRLRQRGTQALVPEAGVAQAVAEREERLDLLRVVPAVADQQALVVVDLAVLAREVARLPRGVGGRIGEPLRERARQLARGAHVAEEQRGERVTGLRAAVPGLQHGRNAREPAAHLDRRPGDQDHDRARVRLGDPRDQRVLAREEREVATVDALVVAERLVRQPADEHDGVRPARGRDGAIGQLPGLLRRGRAQLARAHAGRVAPPAEAPLRLAVSLREDDVGLARHPRQDALERGRLAEGLDARRVAARREAPHRVVADHRDRLQSARGRAAARPARS